MLHGDVHPRNIVVAGDRVVLLDFGVARLVDEPPRVGRAGVPFFFEPEHELPSSPAGEQYALAALLYLLIAGRHYLDFRLDREELERQIETDSPAALVDWPEPERILFRALEKDPARRYASIADMARELFLERTLQSLPEAYPPPTASIYFGAAGAAIGLLRISPARADVWRSRAEALIGTEGAYDAGEEVPRGVIGEVSPYHTESGIHAAAAMIAAARSDAPARRRAIEAFLVASRRPCPELDLTLGRSGSLLAAAMLMRIDDDPALRAFGSETMTAIWNARPNRRYTGMAHGWTGYLYAALRWCEASGDALPPRLIERLRRFAAKKVLHGRGAYWPAELGKEHHPIPGWCNGSAGQLFLFTLAHRLLGDDEWLRLAELCAWNTWDENRPKTSLCCGSAGRAYALLNLYNHTGEAAWLDRARQLAGHAAAGAVATSQHAHSLWQGELGVAVLVADLASPETARMPFFE